MVDAWYVVPGEQLGGYTTFPKNNKATGHPAYPKASYPKPFG